MSPLESDDSFFRLMHLSDPPGGPINLPFASGTYYASRFTEVIPEQSKYTTELTLRPDDPTRVEEIYVFLPSLRRSLRLSSAARCAPILGTDFIEDDNAWLPPNFRITLLGKKEIAPSRLWSMTKPSTGTPISSFPLLSRLAESRRRTLGAARFLSAQPGMADFSPVRTATHNGSSIWIRSGSGLHSA